MWSAGNGGVIQDSCAYDEYVNNIYSIAVSAIGRKNRPLYGSERCSAIMVATYSKDRGDDDVPMVNTTFNIVTITAEISIFYCLLLCHPEGRVD